MIAGSYFSARWYGNYRLQCAIAPNCVVCMFSFVCEILTSSFLQYKPNLTYLNIKTLPAKPKQPSYVYLDYVHQFICSIFGKEIVAVRQRFEFALSVCTLLS